MNFQKPIKDFHYDDLKKVYVDSSIISKFLTKTFSWMFLGLLMTFLTVVVISRSYGAMNFFFGNGAIPFFLILMLEVGISIYLSNANINRIPLSRSKTLFILYSLANGITLSFFAFYDPKLIAFVIMLTGILFGAMALYGYLTKEDFSKYTAIINISLIILVVAIFINMFLKITIFNLAIGYIGAITFIFLIAYDVNRLRRMAVDLAQYETPENIDKYSIRGALSLYINVITLFLYIMRIVSSQNRKNK